MKDRRSSEPLAETLDMGHSLSHRCRRSRRWCQGYGRLRLHHVLCALWGRTPLDPLRHEHQRDRQYEIKTGEHQVDLERFESLGDELIRLEGDLGHGDDGRKRAALDGGYDHIHRSWETCRKRLRQRDEPD